MWLNELEKEIMKDFYKVVVDSLTIRVRTLIDCQKNN